MNTAIPVYPPDSPSLLIALIDREAARLEGPTVGQALADDKTGDDRLAYATAHANLRAARAWVEHKVMLSSHEGCSDVD